MSSWSIDWLLPDNDDPASLRKYRLRVGAIACSTWLFVFPLLLPFLLSAFFGGLPKVGTVVWAAELDNRVDTRVDKRIGALESDVAEIKEVVGDLTEANKASAAAALGNTIIQATRERCKALAAGRPGDAWADRILELRRQYRALTSELFEPLTCADV